jgi:sugar phosphate isomerase/epimerase
VEAAPLSDIARLSLNQITIDQWSLTEAIDGCLRKGIRAIAPWRHKIKETGLDKAARMLRESGLSVSSLCRGGFFPANEGERAARLDDNRRAVDEAAELGAPVLVLVCGGAPDRDLRWARAMVQEGIEELAPYARAAGVRLGIEPLHPMFAADRSVVVTLGQAIDLATAFETGDVGVILDVYHVWWDPNLDAEIARAGARIFGFHVADWITPLADVLAGRGLMGSGVIELRRIRSAVERAGYLGPIEVEVLSRSLWERPGDEVLDQVIRGYLAHV